MLITILGHRNYLIIYQRGIGGLISDRITEVDGLLLWIRDILVYLGKASRGKE